MVVDGFEWEKVASTIVVNEVIIIISSLVQIWLKQALVYALLNVAVTFIIQCYSPCMKFVASLTTF